MVDTHDAKKKQSDHLTPRDNCMLCICDQPITLTVWGQYRAYTLTVFAYLSLIWCHHPRMKNYSSISVIMVPLRTWEAHHRPRFCPSLGLWWASHYVGEGRMTEIEVSIPTNHFALDTLYWVTYVGQCCFTYIYVLVIPRLGSIDRTIIIKSQFH